MTQRATARAFVIWAMETCWLSATIALFWGMFGRVKDPPFFFGVLALFAAGYGTAWLLQHLDLGERTLQGTAIVLGFLAISVVATIELHGWAGLLASSLWLETIGRAFRWFDGLGKEAFAFAAGVAVWWRGSRWAQGPHITGFSYVLDSFRWGTVLVVLGVLAEGFLEWPARATLVAIPFFAFGLLALVITHLTEVYPRAVSDRRWQGMALGTVVLLIAIGLLLGQPGILRLDMLAPLAAALGFIAERILFVVLYPFGLLAHGIVAFLQSIFHIQDLPDIRLAPLLEESANRLPQEGGAAFPSWLAFALKTLIVALVIAGVSWVIARSFRWRRVRRDEEDQYREAVEAPTTLIGEMTGLLKRWLRGAQRARRETLAALPELLTGPEAVMLLYRNMCLFAASLGHPRLPAETPYEYRERLAKALPDEPVTEITEAFVGTRYGGQLPSRSWWERLRELWQVLVRAPQMAQTEGDARETKG